MKPGFIGLGTMGAPMAGHLLPQNGTLMVWNRTASKAGALVAAGAKLADSIEDLGAQCDAIFLCVSRTEDVEEIVGALETVCHAGTVIVDHSTIAPAGARAIHERLKANRIGFVDAPITGGSMGAQKGTLTIFCGGDEPDIEGARPFMSAYGKRIERVGSSGAGQMMKMANQIAVGGALLALCESLAFAKRAGLNLAQTRELLAGGAAGSWAFENYGPKILSRDWSPGFTVKNQRKDFAYVMESAGEIDADVPGTRLVDSLLAKLEEEGHDQWTTAALFELMAR